MSRARATGRHLQEGVRRQLSRAVARLEDGERVIRKPDPSDGRSISAVLTDTGRAAVVDAAPEHVEAVNQLVFDVLTAIQARELGIIAIRVLHAIDSESDLTSELRP